MKWYLYIMSTADNFIYLGVCKDVPAMLKFYDSMPTLKPGKLQRMVYLADADEKTAKNYFLQLCKAPKEEKVKLIESFNPTWAELVPGVNIHL